MKLFVMGENRTGKIARDEVRNHTRVFARPTHRGVTGKVVNEIPVEKDYLIGRQSHTMRSQPDVDSGSKRTRNRC